MTVQAERVEALWPFDLSVKLPAALVQQAREAAQPLRRCVAGQIDANGRNSHHERPCRLRRLKGPSTLAYNGTA